MGNTDRVELNDLRAFLAIVDEGGIRPAARALDLTPGAVSRAIDRLEASVGVTLVSRHTGSVAALTDRGAAFLAEVRPAFAYLGRGVLMARHAIDGAGVTLGLPPLPPVAQLHRLIAAAEKVTEPAGLTLRRISWRDCFDGSALRSGRIDAAVSLLPGTSAGLCEIAVEPLRRVAVLPTSHPLARHPRVTIADLDGEPAIVAAALSTSSARLWALDPQSDGKTRRYARRPRSVSAMLSAIARGHGFTTMPLLTPLMWQRSDLAWPVLDAPPSWLGFTCGPHTPASIVEALRRLTAPAAPPSGGIQLSGKE